MEKISRTKVVDLLKRRDFGAMVNVCLLYTSALMIICKGWKSYTINEVLAILYRQELKSELSLFAKIPSCTVSYTHLGAEEKGFHVFRAGRQHFFTAHGWVEIITDLSSVIPDAITLRN